AEFFFRIAQALPDRFRIVGCVARTEATRSRIGRAWGIATFNSIGDLVRSKPDFVVTSVPWAESAPVILELASHDVGVLAESPIVAGSTRAGPPQEERKILTKQTIASLEFEGKLAVFDFVEDQYFSWIRSHRVLVRGDRGEINNLDVRYLIDFATPMEMQLK